MKKLLTIVLVLALAPMAFGNATLSSGGESTLIVGLSGDVTVGDVITVDLTIDSEVSGISYIAFRASGTSVPSLAVGSWGPMMQSAPDNGTLVGTDIEDAESFMTAGWSLGTGSLGVATGTILYSFSATVNGEGSIDADMGSADLFFDLGTPGYFAPGSTFVGLNIIPEPMTIALLGLGGLFLVRRRK